MIDRWTQQIQDQQIPILSSIIIRLDWLSPSINRSTYMRRTLGTYTKVIPNQSDLVKKEKRIRPRQYVPDWYVESTDVAAVAEHGERFFSNLAREGFVFTLY